MNRKEFIKICSILGIGFTAQSPLVSCNKDEIKFSGKVIIIGAGAGGLSAGYLLQQKGIDFEILEASSAFGGRMKIDTTFADFPIPLGSEWIESNPNVFKEIINNKSVHPNIQTFSDNPDYKFLNFSWFNFFEQYIHPSVESKIRYGQTVQNIDYSGSEVIVTTQNSTFTADKVILSVPLKIIQNQSITFSPNLPQSKSDAINSVTIWEGFKAFFEFSEKFYDDEFEFKITPNTDGQKIYYNAALGQNTNKNILGLFSVGTPAQEFGNLSSLQLKDFVLNELDSIYSNQATQNYIKHTSQNWNNEPHIQSGYLSDYADWRKVREIGKSVNKKLYFAGGEFTDGEDWVSVHIAASSAKNIVNEILY